MEVRGLGWLGIRTSRFEETTSFFREVMGPETVRQERDVVEFRFPDDAEMEVWRPEDEFHDFFGTVQHWGRRVEQLPRAGRGRLRDDREGVLTHPRRLSFSFY